MAAHRARHSPQRTGFQLIAVLLISYSAGILAAHHKGRPSSDPAPAPQPSSDAPQPSAKGGWQPKLKGSKYDPSKVDWEGVVSACRAIGTFEKRLYSFFIRATFHDSMSFLPDECDAQGAGCGGTDSSLLLSVEEMTRPENNMHKFSYYVSQASKKIASFYDCSVADVLAVCGGVAIHGMTNNRLRIVGGKGKDFRVGRYDSEKAAPHDLLPGAEDNLEKFAKFFIDRDFEMDQAVALMGTHSLLQNQVCAEYLGGPLCDPSGRDTCRQVLQFKLDNHYFNDLCSSDSEVVPKSGGGGSKKSSYDGGSKKTSYGGSSKKTTYNNDDNDDDDDGGDDSYYKKSNYGSDDGSSYSAPSTYGGDDDDGGDDTQTTSQYDGGDDDAGSGYRRSLLRYKKKKHHKKKKYIKSYDNSYSDGGSKSYGGGSKSYGGKGKSYGSGGGGGLSIYKGYQANPRCQWTSEEFRSQAGALDSYYPGSKFNYQVTWVNSKYDVPWPYTTQDGFFGQACQGRYPGESSSEAVKQIAKAMRRFSASRSDWESVLYKAYHKMVHDWVEWSPSGGVFKIDGTECPSGKSGDICKTAFKNGVALKINV